MLKLTVLLRYWENGRRSCELLGEMAFNYSKGKLSASKGATSKISGKFNEEYSYEKEMIYQLFTTEKSLEKVFKKIEKIGLKITEVNFNDDDNVQVVILIDE